MTKWISRILVHLVSVLIVLPFGWCCWLRTAQAEQPNEQSESCCCCHAKPVKPTTPPSKPAEESPEAPLCWCDPQPAALTDTGAGKIDVALAFAPAVPIDTLYLNADAFSVWLRWSLPRSESPPLHVLHCSWLC